MSNAQKILAITHSTLTKVRDLPLVDGMLNSAKIAFQFRTSDWDNTTKTAVFVPGDARISINQVFHIILDENNECIIPHEVLNGNSFSVGVFGINKEYTISSNWMYYKYSKGPYSNGVTPSDPTPTIYEQILDKLDEMSIASDNKYYTKVEVNELLGMSDNKVAILNGGSVAEEGVEA